jgi:hypothetical protein
MAKKDDKLTSVKIPPILFEDFKVATIRDKFSLQKLVERSIFLYLKDEDFKRKLLNTVNTEFTGSI